MLPTATADFPYPGSSALFEDRLWRVHRHNPDGTATIYEDGTTGASGHRTVPIADLTDPACRIARRKDARLAVRLALNIKHLDAIHLSDAIDRAQIIKAEYRLMISITPSRICAILADLGWRRGAMTRGPIVYLRGAATMQEVAA